MKAASASQQFDEFPGRHGLMPIKTLAEIGARALARLATSELSMPTSTIRPLHFLARRTSSASPASATGPPLRESATAAIELDEVRLSDDRYSLSPPPIPKSSIEMRKPRCFMSQIAGRIWRSAAAISLTSMAMRCGGMPAAVTSATSASRLVTSATSSGSRLRVTQISRSPFNATARSTAPSR